MTVSLTIVITTLRKPMRSTFLAFQLRKLVLFIIILANVQKCHLSKITNTKITILYIYLMSYFFKQKDIWFLILYIDLILFI